MLNAFDFVSHVRQDSEFFLEFPPQRVARLLSFFNLSAGKLPLQRHGLVPRPLAHQQLAVFHDKACDHALHILGTSGSVACSALATGSTQLVKVKANAATPVEHCSSNSCSPNSWLSTRKYIRAESTIT